MNCAKYLCIDDQPENIIQPMLDRLEGASGLLKFERMHPQHFVDQFSSIDRFIAGSNCHGVLIDLRLDQLASDQDGTQVYYRGPTLAQELRTRMAEGGLSHFPIVLWSMNDNIISSYAPDSSSHDLFDAVYAKDNPDFPLDESVATQLRSLAYGYSFLKECERAGGDFIIRALALGGEEEVSSLDARILSFFPKGSVYEFAGKALRGLIKKEGALISEQTLAARLGVDIAASGCSWNGVLDALKDARYQGVFGDAWQRWWWHRLESLVARVSGKPLLQRYGAEERVSVLNERLGLSLAAAKPISDGYSDKYFTTCVATGRPLDPLNGFKVYSEGDNPWDDLRYVSGWAALERINRDKWMIDPLEMERYNELKGRS